MFPRRSRTDPGGADWLTVGSALGAVLLLYYVLPLFALATAQSPGELAAQLSDGTTRSAALTSLGTATVSTVVATAFGVPLAYWLARTAFRWRNAVIALAVLPLVLPPVVSGMVLLLIVGPDAPIGRLAAVAGVPLTRSFAGIVLAQTFVASPFVVLTATAAFEGVDRHLEEASRTLGESRAATFRRVTLPLAWPGILAGVTLAFARSLGEFGATIMLAYYPRTMPVQIWVGFTTRGLEGAFPPAVILVGIAVGTLAVLYLLGEQPWG